MLHFSFYSNPTGNLSSRRRWKNIHNPPREYRITSISWTASELQKQLSSVFSVKSSPVHLKIKKREKTCVSTEMTDSP